jgi:hypothetical protein
MTVAFKELAGSPVETYSAEGLKAQRRILVAWEDRHQMAAELLGDGQEFGGMAQAGYPDCSGVVVMQARLEPWPPCPDDQGAFDDVASQLNSYSGKYVQIVADYELLDASLSRPDLPRPRSGTFLTYRMDFGGEYAALPGETLYWASDAGIPVPPHSVPVVRVPITEHRVTWHRVVNPPWAAIRSCIGTVNDGAFLGAAAETVLFDGAAADKQFIRISQLKQPEFGWRITYVFREKAIHAGGNTYGWNHRYRPLPQDNPGWDKLVDKNNNYLYRTADFGALFQFAATA